MSVKVDKGKIGGAMSGMMSAKSGGSSSSGMMDNKKDWRNPKEDVQIRIMAAKRIATIFKRGSTNRDERREYRVLVALEHLCYHCAESREEYTDPRSFEILLHRVASEKAKRRRDTKVAQPGIPPFQEMLKYFLDMDPLKKQQMQQQQRQALEEEKSKEDDNVPTTTGGLSEQMKKIANVNNNKRTIKDSNVKKETVKEANVHDDTITTNLSHNNHLIVGSTMPIPVNFGVVHAPLEHMQYEEQNSRHHLQQRGGANVSAQQHHHQQPIVDDSWILSESDRAMWFHDVPTPSPHSHHPHNPYQQHPQYHIPAGIPMQQHFHHIQQNHPYFQMDNNMGGSMDPHHAIAAQQQHQQYLHMQQQQQQQQQQQNMDVVGLKRKPQSDHITTSNNGDQDEAAWNSKKIQRAYSSSGIL